MVTSALEVLNLFQERADFLESCEEQLAEREYVICVDADAPVAELHVSLCLRHSNTTLTSLPCQVVDPGVPGHAKGDFDPAQAFFVTPSNLTAFGWYVSGLPDAMLQWNEINRLLYREKRAPRRSA